MTTEISQLEEALSGRKRRALRRQARVQRQQDCLERIAGGFNHKEISKVLGVSPARVHQILAPFWPFAPAGRDWRYIIAKITPEGLAALDSMAADMVLDGRLPTLTRILAAVLEDDAHVARRTLGIRRREVAP